MEGETVMSNKTESTRRLLELQGFYGVEDSELSKVDSGLRVSPVICAMTVAVATITANANLFWGLLPFALAGALFPGHPFDVVYNHGLRHWTKGPRLPRYPAPRRFTCLLASAFIAASAFFIQSGAVETGQILGGILVATALVPILTGFCVPSFLYRLVTGKIDFGWSVRA
jgi:hypothetical protein